MKSLVIVESPTKARTISRFLGNNFTVESSYGHVRDLPSSKLGVDTENNFEPHYIIPLKAKPAVKQLKSDVEKADTIILATDEDREGESIAWHLVQALNLENPKSEIRNPKQIERIVFHEITKKAVEEALKHPREIDLKLVNAQQARRILDRLVGYKLSPFLWKKIYKGLSAGRVQSVAVRLIVEREREIQQFKAEEFWTISGLFSKTGEGAGGFEAVLTTIGENAIGKFDIKNEADARALTKRLEKATWSIANFEKKSAARNPMPPFTTSTLQQTAFQRLGFSTKQTMRLAQQLYEGIELGEGSTGLITYMRTDSVNLSEDSLKEARAFIKKEIGDAYSLPVPRRFKTKSKGAQEAHEAIRPTDPWQTPDSIKDFLEPRAFKLYDLVWRRFVASQMPSALFDNTAVDIEGHVHKKTLAQERYIFHAMGQSLTFDGFLKVYPLKFAEFSLPDLKKGDELDLHELKPIQHFTEPPPRFSEASLIKILEKNGIGRPSTYAPTIATIQERNYVQKNEKRQLAPTDTGFRVNDMLVEHFPEIVDIQFTAKMETELDEIADGVLDWRDVLREFYIPFAKNLETKYVEVEKQDTTEKTDKVCEKCGKPMIIRMGRFGRFMACSGFPDCKNAKPIKDALKDIGMKCPKCNDGDVVIKRTKQGRQFFGCSRYPTCDYASWQDPRKDTINAVT